MYDDDDNPDDATALAAEDTAVTGRATETTTLVRVLLEATGNPAAVGFKIQVVQSGDSADLYEDI